MCWLASSLCIVQGSQSVQCSLCGKTRPCPLFHVICSRPRVGAADEDASDCVLVLQKGTHLRALGTQSAVERRDTLPKGVRACVRACVRAGDAVHCGGCLRTFWRNMLSLSSGWKSEPVGESASDPDK
jgi:hypothetical protein